METTVSSTGNKFYGWINVIFMFLIYSFMIGFVFYGFTVIFPAMVEGQGWSRGSASIAHTIRGLIVGFMTPLVALSIGKFGSRKTLNMGLVVGIIGLILLGTATTEVWQWILIWGFVMPTCFALGGILPIQTTINFWFNKKRATATGIVMTGGAVAGFLAAPFYTAIIKKSGSWETGWLVAAGFCGAGLVASFFIKNMPHLYGQHPDGIDPAAPVEEASPDKPKKAEVYQTKEPWTLKEALRTKLVWLQMVCMIAQAWALYMITTHGVLHFIDSGLEAMDAAKIISVLILCSGFARFPTGLLADRVEPRILATIALLGMSITMIALWKVPTSLPLLLGCAAVYGFCFGVTAITFPLITANYFGPAAFAPINGFFGPVIISLCAPVPVLAGYIADHFGTYDLAFLPITVMLFIGTVFAWFLFPPQKPAVAAE